MTDMLGNAGLTPGHPQQVRPVFVPDDDDEALTSPDGSWRPAMPPQCLRVFSSPLGAECPQGSCQGVQDDGGCLVDIVRRAQAAGIEWSFVVDSHGRWSYSGPPLP